MNATLPTETTARFIAELDEAVEVLNQLVIAEEASHYEFEDTVSRIEQTGFIDGMAYALHLLTGLTADVDTANTIRDTREAWKSTNK
jgi:hypothetical protein